MKLKYILSNIIFYTKTWKYDGSVFGTDVAG